MQLPPNTSALRCRIAIGTAFFCHGLAFSSWASRIPTIQTKLSLSASLLGTLLFALPLGSILTSLVSARLVSQIGIRRALAGALLGNCLLYTLAGLATSPLQLGLVLFCSGCVGNMINVSVNTQAVGLEFLLRRPILASFHGIWSSAGFVGAAIGSFMMGESISPAVHFAVIGVVIAILLGVNVRALLRQAQGEQVRSRAFVRPPPALIGLGLIAFCSMICEGTMFDWSGVYFQDIIKAPPALVSLGYGSFMCAMATTRFVADRLTARFGMRRILSSCGLLVAAGLSLAVIQPNLTTGVIGFLLVGAGTSAVVPLVISQAGKSHVLTPSAAIAATSTIGFIGFLIGPPLIGWIAGLASLRLSFLVMAVMGLGITLMGRRQFPAEVVKV